MAEFSKEWLEKEGIKNDYDFSINDVFQKLKEGHKIEVICEGFGITAVGDDDDECYVVIKGEVKSFFEVSGIKLEKEESSWDLRKLFTVLGIAWLIFAGIILIFFNSDLGPGTFGDAFGALNALFSGLALGGIIFTIYLQKTELKLQRKELKQTRNEFKIQNETLKLQRFESTFFQMITLHHEIIDKLEYQPKKEDLWMLDREFETLSTEDSGSLVKRGVLKAAALYLSRLMEREIHELLLKREEITGPESILLSKAEAWVIITKSHDWYFRRCQFNSKLSHYFRNLYHIFKFIHQSKNIDDIQKQHYSAMLRAQLSPDELFLVFYNGMIEGCGNPKFLFLIREFDITKNMDSSLIRKFDQHQAISDELRQRVTNQLAEMNPIAVIPNQI